MDYSINKKDMLKESEKILEALENYYNFVEDRESETQKEQLLLRYLEQEVNQLKYTLESYTKHLDQ